MVLWTVSAQTNAGNAVSMTMFFDFGTDTGLSTDIVAGDGSYDLASRIADVINDLTSFTAKRGGTSNDNAAFVVVSSC